MINVELAGSQLVAYTRECIWMPKFLLAGICLALFLPEMSRALMYTNCDAHKQASFVMSCTLFRRLRLSAFQYLALFLHVGCFQVSADIFWHVFNRALTASCVRLRQDTVYWLHSSSSAMLIVQVTSMCCTTQSYSCFAHQGANE